MTMGSTMAPTTGSRAENAAHHLSATAWMPSAVRCRQCHELAHMELTERISDEEITVRYVCPDCRSHQIRHYHEHDMERDLV